MINGRRHIRRPGRHLAVFSAACHAMATPTVEVGQAMAAFLPGKNIHQFLSN